VRSANEFTLDNEGADLTDYAAANAVLPGREHLADAVKCGKAHAQEAFVIAAASEKELGTFPLATPSEAVQKQTRITRRVRTPRKAPFHRRRSDHQATIRATIILLTERCIRASAGRRSGLLRLDMFVCGERTGVWDQNILICRPLSESLPIVERFRASRIRTLLQDGVTICGEVKKDSSRYMRALI